MVSGLESIPQPGEPEKRGRGRPPGPAKEKTSSTLTKTGRPSKKHDAEQTKTMIQTLLMVSFNITSVRAGDHWKLTAVEAEALAEPIAAIMERHNLTEISGAYGDYIALIAAIGMVIVPKVMTSMDKRKQRGGLTLVKQPKQAAGTPAAAGGKPTPNPDATANADSDRSVQQRDTYYPASDVKRSLAHFG